MLDFPLKLEGTFLHNVRMYKAIMNMCAREQRPFTEAIKLVRSRFQDLSDEQFLELRYEMHELGCVNFKRERNIRYDRFFSSSIRDMLDNRNEPEFYVLKFIQTMGRGMRMPTNPMDLIGKKVNIQIKRDKD